MHTFLLCSNCNTPNHDPGGNESAYVCGHCGQPALHRVSVPVQHHSGNNSTEGAIAGATLLGLATANPIGAVVGAILGGILGAQVRK
jgi:hypothetical protein